MTGSPRRRRWTGSRERHHVRRPGWSGRPWSARWSSSSSGLGAAAPPQLLLRRHVRASVRATPSTGAASLHAIVGTLIQIGIAIALTLPLGIGTAVFMTEVGGTFARRRPHHRRGDDRAALDRGRPVHLHRADRDPGRPASGLAASMALGVMMLPIIARAADVVLRVVPGGLREASLALGASRWRTVWHVVLPTARPGLATALILGVARGVGETSPVLLTSGCRDLPGHQPDRRRHELAAALHLQGRAQPRADGHRARLRRRDRAADPRARCSS